MSVGNQTFGGERNELQAINNFLDRRDPDVRSSSPGLERRQFSDGHSGLSEAAAELGIAIDQYKLTNRRRYISYEEMLSIISSLGYKKSDA